MPPPTFRRESFTVYQSPVTGKAIAVKWRSNPLAHLSFHSQKPIRIRVLSKIPPLTPIAEIARTAISPLCLKRTQNQRPPGTMTVLATGERSRYAANKIWALWDFLCKLKCRLGETYPTFQGYVKLIKDPSSGAASIPGTPMIKNRRKKKKGPAHKVQRLHSNAGCQVQTTDMLGSC